MAQFQEASGDIRGARKNYIFARDKGRFGLGERAARALENLE